jgi:tetratricopeptide (TPR) repeat protein
VPSPVTGDLSKAADVYHHLGNIAYLQSKYEKAESNYKVAMKIYEDLEDWNDVADEYHQMGNIAFLDGNNEEAKAYYIKAIPIFQQANDFYKLTGTFLMLGNTLARQKDYPKALQIYYDGFILALQHCQESIEVYIDKFKTVLEAIEESQFSTIWKEVTGSEFEGEIRDVIIKNE